MTILKKIDFTIRNEEVISFLIEKNKIFILKNKGFNNIGILIEISNNSNYASWLIGHDREDDFDPYEENTYLHDLFNNNCWYKDPDDPDKYFKELKYYLNILDNLK